MDLTPGIKLLTYTRHNDDIVAKGFPHLAGHHSVEFIDLLRGPRNLSVDIVSNRNLD